MDRLKQQIGVDTLKAFLEAFNRHDIEAILEFFADDCVMELLGDLILAERVLQGRNRSERGARLASRACPMLTIAMIITG